METGKTIIALLFILLLGFLPAGPALAAPHAVNYQGILNDSAGSPVPDQTFNMVFRIYDAATGGTLLYEESQSVATSKGIYNVLLGTGTPTTGTFDAALFSADNRWLEVEVNAEILSPRQQVTSVAFSLHAEEAAHAATADDATTLAGQPAAAYDQSAHVTDTGNPHYVTAAQVGAATPGDIAAHGANASAHHTKTTSFTELTDTAADSQIPATIARDSELTWGNLAGIPTGFSDGIDNDSGGDITGVTAGTGLSGGGINGDITLGIQLPLSLTGSSANPLVRSENAGNGWAFYGISHGSNSAVYGYNSPTGFMGNLGASNAGVKGSASGSGYGVYGSHSGGNYGWMGSTFYGVFGYGSGTYSGVYGTNSGGNFGVLGHAAAGVYGQSAGGNVGYLGSSAYGVYGSSGTGTAGYFTSPSGYGLIVDSGKVGIGTSSPTHLLDLASTSGLFMGLDFGLDQNAGITFSEAGTARWIFPFFRGWQSDNMIVRDESSHTDVMTFEAGTGKVGIGTSTPGEKLEVANGNVKSDRIIYNNPHQHTLSIPHEAFHSSVSVYVRNGVLTTPDYVNDNSGVFFIDEPSYHTLIAPVNLPDGATVTLFTIYGSDVLIAPYDMKVSLRWESYATQSYVDLASATTSGDIGYQSVSDTTINSPIIDNINGGYSVHVEKTSGQYWTGNLRLLGVVITYTLPEAP